VIAVTLRGGLGNQMFQYAAGRSLALRHATGLELDTSELAAAGTPRAYALGAFALPVRVVDGVRSIDPRVSAPLRAAVATHARALLGAPVRIHQKGFELQERFFAAPRRTHLVGFWQSEAYFADHADQIRRDFAPAGSLPTEADELVAEVDGAGTVAVHVRRGDYAADPATRAFHGLLAPGYYANAVAEVARRAQVARAFVFSDDPAWCRRHLSLPVEATVVEGDWPDWVDLVLMSRCAHHVIANSSFSWWGAWLGPAGGVVIAPSSWTRGGGDDSAVVPQRWIRL
jgi:hypothetical protein